MREEVRKIMRYSGLRMVYKHPIAALRHMIDRRRKEPIPQKPKAADEKQQET
jgi:hypothetical protein